MPCACAVLALSPSVLADEDAAREIRLLIRDASRALQAGNAPLFLAAFDKRAFSDFPMLRDEVTALTAQRRIASSVESGSPVGAGGARTVRVDWLLDLTPKIDPGPLERRHESIVMTVAKRGGRWRVIGMQPAGFFRSVRRLPPRGGVSAADP